MKNNSKLFMVLSMLIFGSIAPFVKNISATSGQIAFYRALTALIVIGGFLALTKEKIPIKELKRDIILLFLSGAALGFNWIFLFEAYKYTTVSLATLSYYFAPVIVVLVSPFLFKENLKASSLICFLVATAGLVMIIGISNISNDEGTITGILLALAAAFLYATVVILNKFIKRVDGIKRTFLQFLSATFVLFPYILLTDKISILGLDKIGIISLITIGVMHSGIAYCMYFSSIKGLRGTQVALLSYIDPLVAVVISFVFLNERISTLQAIGGFMILLATFINEKITTKTRA